MLCFSIQCYEKIRLADDYRSLNKVVSAGLIGIGRCLSLRLDESEMHLGYWLQFWQLRVQSNISMVA